MNSAAEPRVPAEPAGSTDPTGSAGTGEVPAIEAWVREILRCPACHGELRDGAGPDGGPELVCHGADACGRAYPVREGIPVLLVDEARGAAQPDGG